jgi:hypothetical protein
VVERHPAFEPAVDLDIGGVQVDRHVPGQGLRPGPARPGRAGRARRRARRRARSPPPPTGSR